MTLLDFLPSLHSAATQRIDRATWPLTASVDDLGRLCVGDVPLTDIADEFRTPTYVLDEADFRRRLQSYRVVLRNVEICYAAKSLLTTDVARWVAAEGVGLDVSSAGELTIALAAGMDPARIVLHGNAKPVDELRDAAGVGRVVVDSPMEIAYLSCVARRPQPVLIRVTPGIDIGGHPAVTTGVDDQKFGFALTDLPSRRGRTTHPAPACTRPGRPSFPHRIASHRRDALWRGHPADDRRDGRHPPQPRRRAA